MQKNKIPETDLEVSEICLGTMTFGTPVGEADAINLIHYAIDKGINFIDTANMYEGYARSAGSSGGVAEEIIGKALVDCRDKVVLATKLGMKVGELPEDEGTSPAAIRKHLDMSLGRLKTDYIDIYYLHKYDPDVLMEEMLAELANAIKAGKIRYYAISNYLADQIQELLNIADANSLPRPVMCQPPLSILKQDALSDIIPLCDKERIAVCPYQILQGGLLTGKYKRNSELPANSRKAEMDNWVWDLNEELFDELERIEKEASAENITMLQYAIRWVLKQPAVVSAIVGVKNKKQIDMAII